MTPRIEPFYSELGRRIQTLRDARALSQERLGQQLDPPMTRASVANIEAGRQRVLAHTLLSLASVLRVPLVELVQSPNRATRPAGDLAGELKTKLKLTPRKLNDLVSKLGGDGGAPP